MKRLLTGLHCDAKPERFEQGGRSPYLHLALAQAPSLNAVRLICGTYFISYGDSVTTLEVLLCFTLVSDVGQ